MFVSQDAYPLPQPTKGSRVSEEGLTKAVNSKTQYSSNGHHIVEYRTGEASEGQSKPDMVPSGQWIKHSLLYPQSAFLSLFQSVGSFLIDLGAAVITNGRLFMEVDVSSLENSGLSHPVLYYKSI